MIKWYTIGYLKDTFVEVIKFDFRQSDRRRSDPLPDCLEMGVNWKQKSKKKRFSVTWHSSAQGSMNRMFLFEKVQKFNKPLPNDDHANI